MNLYTEQLRLRFNEQMLLQKRDLFDFYAKFVPNISESIFAWYLTTLQQKRVISTIAPELFQLAKGKQPLFTPIIDEKLLDINQAITQKYDLDEYCLWTTTWLNEFMVHQVMRNMILVEVENEVSESVFYYLRDLGHKDVFLFMTKADEALLERYIFESPNPIIVTKIVGKSPVKKMVEQQNTISTPKLEKILVDLFCDDALLVSYKGAEQHAIFENALTKYSINFKTMFAYSVRRKKERQLMEYLYLKFPEIVAQTAL